MKFAKASSRFFTVSTAALFVLSLFLSVQVPAVKADVTGERSFSTTAADSILSYWSLNWAEAWGAYEANWHDAAGSILIGGIQYSPEFPLWNINRACFYFDTSEIPDGATIDSAILSLYVLGDNSSTDFNVTIQGTATYPHIPSEVADYYQGWYGTSNLGSRSTNDSMSEFSYWNITFNSAGRSLVSTTGYTRLMVRATDDINNITPTNQEWITIAARDAGELHAARLYVSYTVSEGSGGSGGVGVGDYDYYFYGPYQDNGELYNGTVNVKLYPAFNTTIEFSLTSDGVTADNATYTLEQAAVLVNWNVSTTGNLTRVHYFTDDTTETVYVCVPDADLPFYLYAFTINDFVGVQNGYLESTLYINGATRVIERQSINTINNAPFYMTWSKLYGMKVTADQGEITVGQFSALSETNPTVIIPAGAFPQVFEGLAVTVAAERSNSTMIQVNYTDSEERTYWVRVYIKHRLSTGAYTTDYYENSTSNIYQLNWNEAHNQTDYVVQVQALRDTLEEWTFYAPYQRVQTNTWEGLDLLGDGLPIAAQYLPATILILAAALAFSYWHISAGAWIAWVVACVCTMFNWLPFDAVSTPVTLGLGAVICAGITIGEFKKGERSL